jgi:DNA-binding transcriptional ArsR family regulator
VPSMADEVRTFASSEARGFCMLLFVATKTDCIDILKALADRTRLRLIKALLADRASVNELTEQLGLSQYNTSKHLRVLKQAGIVDVEAVGARREYSIAPEFRRRLQREGPVLDFGCCTFRFDQLPD